MIFYEIKKVTSIERNFPVLSINQTVLDKILTNDKIWVFNADTSIDVKTTKSVDGKMDPPCVIPAWVPCTVKNMVIFDKENDELAHLVVQNSQMNGWEKSVKPVNVRALHRYTQNPDFFNNYTYAHISNDDLRDLINESRDFNFTYKRHDGNNDNGNMLVNYCGYEIRSMYELCEDSSSTAEGLYESILKSFINFFQPETAYFAFDAISNSGLYNSVRISMKYLDLSDITSIQVAKIMYGLLKNETGIISIQFFDNNMQLIAKVDR